MSDKASLQEARALSMRQEASAGVQIAVMHQAHVLSHALRRRVSYSELTMYDALTLEADHAIDLLQERRTALISAAVTGQIDVRERV